MDGSRFLKRRNELQRKATHEMARAVFAQLTDVKPDAIMSSLVPGDVELGPLQAGQHKRTHVVRFTAHSV